MNHKDTKKSAIHENADASITCNFGDGDISRLGVAYLTHVIHRYITTSIILRCPYCTKIGLSLSMYTKSAVKKIVHVVLSTKVRYLMVYKPVLIINSQSQDSLMVNVCLKIATVH